MNFDMGCFFLGVAVVWAVLMIRWMWNDSIDDIRWWRERNRR